MITRIRTALPSEAATWSPAGSPFSETASVCARASFFLEGGFQTKGNGLWEGNLLWEGTSLCGCSSTSCLQTPALDAVPNDTEMLDGHGRGGI